MEDVYIFYAASYPNNLCGLNEDDFVFPWSDSDEKCPEGRDEEDIAELCHFQVEELSCRRRSVSMTVVETAMQASILDDSSNLALDSMSQRGTSHLHGFLAQRRTKPKSPFGNAPRSRTSSLSAEYANSPHSRARKISFRVKRSTPNMATRKAPILPFGTSNEFVSGTEVMYGRRNSIAVGAGMKRSTRRCSEPFLFNAPLSSKLKKQSLSGNRQPYTSRRRLSTTAALLPATSKHKLHALAKDELLASLNLPLDVSEHKSSSRTKESSASAAKATAVEERQGYEEKRIKVIEEILETEKKYLACLSTLNEVFRKPMQESSIVPEKDVKVMFPAALNDIQDCHNWFMKEFDERVNSTSLKGMVGDTFAKLSDSGSDDLLQIYTGYVNAFPKSVSTLSRYTRTSQKFRRFLEACAENPQCDGLELTSFLLTPVQRLPRYVLLLRQLLKYTSEDHLDYKYVREALQKMEGLIESLNGSIQNSMQVYSAGESERRKIIRRQLSRRRKKANKPVPIEIRCKENAIGRPQIISPVTPMPESELENSPSSVSPQKSSAFNFPGVQRGTSVENYENDAPLNRRSSSTPDVLSSSDAASRTSSNDNESGVSFRNRNSEFRKSWRRSFGAMISSMWSGKDEKDPESDDRLASPSIEDSRVEIQHPQRIKRHSVGHGPTSRSFARRKYGVAYPVETANTSVLNEYVEHGYDPEPNNNDHRRKTSTSSRDKKRSSWMLINGWKKNSTPQTSDEEYGSSVDSGQTRRRRSLRRSTSSSVISDRERDANDLPPPASPTLHRGVKNRSSGRSTGLSSFFHKAKQRQDQSDVGSVTPTQRNSDDVSHRLNEREEHTTNGVVRQGSRVSKTVSSDGNFLSRSPSLIRKGITKSRRQSAPVQAVMADTQQLQSAGQWSVKSKKTSTIREHESPKEKVVGNPKDSKGKLKKALKHIVGRTKS